MNLMESGTDDVDPDNYRLLFEVPQKKFITEADANQLVFRRDPPESDFRSELTHCGIISRAAATLNSEGPWIDFLAAQISDTNQMEVLRQNENVNIALSGFSAAVSLSRVLSALKAKYNAALSAMDKLGLGVFLTTSNGEIIHTNTEGRRILSLKDGITKHVSGKIYITDREAHAELTLAISNALSVGSNHLMSLSEVPPIW